MNTAPKLPFVLSAKYLGPVLSLTGKITPNSQNLIYARNGTGKSFLSRAFRYLDLHGQGIGICNAARDLVSDESSDGKGEFLFTRGTQPTATAMGKLQLEKAKSNVTAQVSDDTIFHVFSDDFVQEELRERSFEINDEIENQILIASESIKLEDAREALKKAQEEEEKACKKLIEKFDQTKIAKLINKAGIHKNLTEYRKLDFEDQVIPLTTKPDLPSRNFDAILNDLDSLKALPSEPAYPEQIRPLSMNVIDLEALNASLKKITSASSISEEIKQRIESCHSFYKTGTIIIQNEGRTTCPFCRQDIIAPDPSSIIDSYIAYFADEEERHKSELRKFDEALDQKKQQVDEVEKSIAQQKARYNALKCFVPSQREVDMHDGESEVKQVLESILSYKNMIKQKANDLSTAYQFPGDDLFESSAMLDKIIEDNNTIVEDLTSAVAKADKERRSLQRTACSVYIEEFAILYWDDIDNLRALRESVQTQQNDLTQLNESSLSTDARVRVAKTFELLLREFFAEKYIFNEEGFTLHRGDYEMTRGPQRTISDGEKTIIAFCYFVACMHRKMKADSDYQKLFLVIDDPVTSLSYDYVFAIVQTLKNLSVSKQGEVSIDPSIIDGHNYVRPEFLILTHSSYFFNLSLTNKVVNNAAFVLYAENDSHKISKCDKYLAPFHQQLNDIYEIKMGKKDPDHGTGNTIRSVLEAVGRFCRPDKCKSLTEFVNFLAGEDGFRLKSVLINSVSHGSYYEEAPTPEDLRLACEETVKVVEKYAIGQLKVVRNATEANN